MLTAALDVAKWLIKTVQNRLLLRLNSSDNIVLKEMNKIGLCVVFLTIAVLMGTCFFAVNEDWTAAQAFYWTIMTMTVSRSKKKEMSVIKSKSICVFKFVFCLLGIVQYFEISLEFSVLQRKRKFVLLNK